MTIRDCFFIFFLRPEMNPTVFRYNVFRKHCYRVWCDTLVIRTGTFKITSFWCLCRFSCRIQGLHKASQVFFNIYLSFCRYRNLFEDLWPQYSRIQCYTTFTFSRDRKTTFISTTGSWSAHTVEHVCERVLWFTRYEMIVCLLRCANCPITLIFLSTRCNSQRCSSYM